MTLISSCKSLSPSLLSRWILDRNPLQYSCLENSMNRGTWRATVPGVAKCQTGLSTRTHGCHLMADFLVFPPALMILEAGSTSLLIQMFKVLICLYFAPFRGLCLTVDCLLELSESRTPDSERGAGRLGGLQSTGLQRVGHDWATEQKQQEAKWGVGFLSRVWLWSPEGRLPPWLEAALAKGRRRGVWTAPLEGQACALKRTWGWSLH